MTIGFVLTALELVVEPSLQLALRFAAAAAVVAVVAAAAS